MKQVLWFVLLRDLWMGKLTFGGEASIGRGRLRGVRAEVIYNGETYTFENEYDAEVVLQSMPLNLMAI